MNFDRLQRTCVRAITGGGKLVSAIKVLWEVHGSCLDPIKVVHFGRPPVDKSVDNPHDYQNTVVVAPGRMKPLELTIMVPCKRCDVCLAQKRRMWSSRGIAETMVTKLRAGRTWVCTLTCSPDYLYRARCSASARMALRGKSFDGSAPEVQFRAIDAAIYLDIQKFFKRLRKGKAVGSDGHGAVRPCRFSYLIVTEAHRSGAPHYHILIHETDPLLPVRQRELKEGQWCGGFSDYRLMHGDARAAGYVCKYLAKQGGRVRASKNYGSHHENGSLPAAERGPRADERHIGPT